jgi:dienelactone hydrolase
MKKGLFFLFSLLAFLNVTGQVPYTQELFNFRVETDIVYGIATNYAGNADTLKLDIYKPVSDNNLKRPLLVLVHGGAWVGGTKADGEVQSLAQLFAKRGYVVASINYRLGMHPSSGGGSNTATCTLVTPEANCAYVADSAEVVRAIYRGMQDVKGAIRFMKGRAAIDSTCKENTYLSGISAGGFCALAAAFLDVEAEKPTTALAIANAELPANSLNYCHNYFNATNASISRTRPDLGSIEGDVALNGNSSKVKGMANFYGGMLTNLFEQYTDETPLLYLFHQTADVVVSCARAPILSELSYNCLDPLGFLGCNHIWNMPWSYGSCSITSLIENSPEPVQFQNAIVNNGAPNCLLQPPGHSILNIPERVNEITNFFGERILTVEQSNCENPTGILNVRNAIKIFPNPGNEQLQIELAFVPFKLEITDLNGRVLVSKFTNQKDIILETSFLSNGFYLLNCISKSGEKFTSKWLHN